MKGKLEVGKTYKTKSGKTIHIESTVTKKSWMFFSSQIFIGKSEGSYFSYYFDKTGNVFGYTDHMDSIQEEVIKPAAVVRSLSSED